MAYIFHTGTHYMRVSASGTTVRHARELLPPLDEDRPPPRGQAALDRYYGAFQTVLDGMIKDFFTAADKNPRASPTDSM